MQKWTFYTLALSCLLLLACSQTKQEDLWHGYKMTEFQFEHKQARVVFPHQANENNLWIWRARFWGHEPQVDTTLLGLGFHLVYVDIADLFGSKEAIGIWDRYYDFVTKSYGLNEKVVLEGFSRGGLIVYNWAAQNLDKVACIYADAPVCDVTSWPGGLGTGIGSPEAWSKCINALDIDTASLENFKLHPIVTAHQVAQANIPTLHVCGNDDQVVPIEENSEVISAVYKEYNAPYYSITKEGIGHHPHSLREPTPIVRFILKHTDSTLLVRVPKKEIKPSVKFRSGFSYSDSIFRNSRSARVVFLGGSITYNGGWRDSLMQHLSRQYPTTKFDFINAGIPSMGSTPGSFRFDTDVLKDEKVDLLFVEAAVNDDTNGRDSIRQIRGMEGIVRQALTSNPSMNILMMHFVDPGKMSDYNHGQVPMVISNHEQVADHYNIPSIDLAKEVNDRILNHEFSWKADFINLHPSPFGQEVYAKTMISTLDSLFKLRSGRQDKLSTPPLNQYSYFNGQFLSIDEANYDKEWRRIQNWTPIDKAPTREGFVNRLALESNTPGAQLTLEFTGTAIGLLVPAGPDAGIISYKIDGKAYDNLDLFTKWSQHLHLPWVYMLADELAGGSHVLEIVVDGEKNELSEGTVCRIFEFVVN